ncbi:MAG: stalk domain-containing protein [Clostridia bacterium]|nr:stalk domain-containing protein [Clostridia bacterium]
MKRKIFALTICLALTLSVLTGAQNSIKVNVNGINISMEQPPVVQNNRTLVPLRAIAENLNCTVDWNSQTKEITLLKNSKVITLQIGSTNISITDHNSQSSIKTDTPAAIINGSAMLPIRTISEIFGATVNWDNIDKTIYINYILKIEDIMSKLKNDGETINIKLIGDSITAGMCGTGYSENGEIIFGSYKANEKGHCWANSLRDYLQDKFNCTVKNYGISGSTSKRLADNISSIVKDTDDIVICMIGTNDRRIQAGLSLDDLYNNLQSILDYCQRQETSVIFMSCMPARTDNDYAENKVFHCEDIDNVIMKFASDNNIEYIPLYKLAMKYCEENNVTIDSLLSEDGLHPNDEGYDVMFNIICSSLGV